MLTMRGQGFGDTESEQAAADAKQRGRDTRAVSGYCLVVQC
jgi:hypothetical protein